MTELKASLSGALDNVAAIVYPRRCVGCGMLVMPSARWCSRCWEGVSISCQREHCGRCGRALGPHQQADRRGRCSLCCDETAVATAVVTVGSYGAVLGQAIRNFKYNADLCAGYVLADLLADTLADQLWLDELDVLTAVPSHWTRRWVRGFAHSRLLAEHVARACALPLVWALQPARAIRPQVGLSHADRQANVKGAFQPAKRVPIDGAVVCLVDDVMTTGATLREAARTLLTAGADRVYAAVIARAQIGYDV